MSIHLGALAGLMAACGLLLVASALRRRRLTLADRLAPYVHAAPTTSGLLGAQAPDADGRTISLVLLAAIGSAGRVLEGLGSSAESVRRRLPRARRRRRRGLRAGPPGWRDARPGAVRPRG